MAGFLDFLTGSAGDVLSPSGILSPNTNLDLTSQFRFDPSVTTTISPVTTTSIDQGGLVNVKGDLSTKKQALMYAPVTIVGSPGASASSSPTLSTRDLGAPMLSIPNLMESPVLLVALGVGALWLLTRK